MKLRVPKKKYFPHSIDYESVIGRNERGNPLFGEPQTLPHVRVDFAVSFSPSDLDGKVEIPNALITVLRKYNPDMPAFEVGHKVLFKEKMSTISKVIPLESDTDHPFGYQLEVV
ncbi:putative minor capsid protein [Enterococcus sp. OL5]|uniref:putative minor capsid protein n=1 Tax=Enterococcus sp. OL5 TaxID=2590214 RepID=UPI0011265F8F|nr:putative minor capsid protein [Enterococcus sp. OL5]TPR55412.1 minor capsid protein [Enterococcus sp. OL5]